MTMITAVGCFLCGLGLGILLERRRWEAIYRKALSET